MQHSRIRRGALAAIAGMSIAALALAGCASERGDGGGDADSTDAAVDGTFVFAASADPANLDPAFAQDGETFRVARQIFEGLVGTEPGTADPAPAARRVVGHQRGRPVVHLHAQGGRDVPRRHRLQRRGRLLQLRPLVQLDRSRRDRGAVVLLRHAVPRATSRRRDDGACYESCTPDGDYAVTINLNQPFAGFVPALSLPSFSMQSPTALEEFDADDVGGSAEAPTCRSTPRRTRPAPARTRSTTWAAGRAGHAERIRRTTGASRARSTRSSSA